MIYSLVILLFFLAIPRPAFGYTRYFLSMTPGISILISLFLYENLKDKINKKIIIIGILSFFISLLLILVLKPQPTLYESDGLIKATNLPDFCFNIFASLPLLIVFFFKRQRKSLILVILFALFLSYSLYFDVNLMANQSLIKEAGNYIKEKTSSNDLIIVPKAIGYYAERRFYINEDSKPDLNFSPDFLYKYFKKSLENREMNDEFFWPKGYFSGVYPPVPAQNILNKVKYVVLYHQVSGKKPEKNIGKFYIYKL